MRLNRFIRFGRSIIIPNVRHIWSNKFHLLRTFQRRLPSLSILNEWLVLVSGDATIQCNSKVASVFSNRWSWSRWYQKLIKNVSEMILSIVSVHSLAPPLSDFYCLFDPSFVYILLRAYDLSLFPTNNMIFICHMISDRWFVSVRKWLFPASPRRYLVANFLHFWFMFLKTSAELYPCFPYVNKITISIWGPVDGMSGIKLVTFVLWMNKVHFWWYCVDYGSGNVIRFQNSWNPFSDPLHIWKYNHALVLSSVFIFLLLVFLSWWVSGTNGLKITDWKANWQPCCCYE